MYAISTAASRLRSQPFVLRMAFWRQPQSSIIEAKQAPCWLSTIAQVREDLKTLNRATESDFLAIGGMLTDLLSSARAMSAEISGMAESISGVGGQAACQALESILHHARTMRGNAEATNGELVRVRELASCIRVGFSGFQQTVSSFQLVATLARIETERLGGAHSELGNLAEEFRSHTANVVAGVASVLEDVSTMEQQIGATVDSVSRMQNEKLKTLPALISGIEANLHAFRARQEKAAAASNALASQLTALSTAIAGIVNSIQFHDITRQQMEHVEEVLTDLTADTAGPTEPSPSQAVILSLQRAQLESAGSLFAASIADIDAQLQTIATQVREMTAAQDALMTLHGGEGESFFQEMEGSFDGIVHAIGSCDVLEKNVTAAIAGSAAVLDRLGRSLGDIRKVTMQVKWLSLNARISAIHLGPSGEPLNIVAESMQLLQSSCEASCEETVAGLTSISVCLKEASGDGRATMRSGDEIRSDVTARTKELRSSGEASTACWQQVGTRAELLASNIQSGRDRLAVGQLVSQTLDRCHTLLSPYAAELGTIEGAAGDALRVEFERIARRYTMGGERDVHERFTGIAQERPAEPDTGAMDPFAEATDFGDNIELF